MGKGVGRGRFYFDVRDDRPPAFVHTEGVATARVISYPGAGISPKCELISANSGTNPLGCTRGVTRPCNDANPVGEGTKNVQRDTR
jgi:hypothetical protein